MAKVSADRPHVPHLGIGHMMGHLHKGRNLIAQLGVVLDVPVESERTDGPAAVPSLSDSRQVGKHIQVDERLRPIDPLPHQERQRRPARNDPGGISVMPQGLDRLLDRRGRDDLKGLHDADPSEARRAPNTLAGVTGRSLTRTPTASKIAFATAGAVGTRTGSPIPFAL